MCPSPEPSCTLTLLKRRDAAGPRTRWELLCEDESLGQFDSLNEALATARTMAAHWLGEAETVRLTGGDLSAVFIDECDSRAPSFAARLNVDTRGARCAERLTVEPLAASDPGK